MMKALALLEPRFDSMIAMVSERHFLQVVLVSWPAQFLFSRNV